MVNYACAAVYTPFAELEKPYQFAIAVVMFGSLLKDSKYTKTLSWNKLSGLATSSFDVNDPLQKEFVDIVDKAKKLYTKRRRKAE
ncbi:MAG: YfbK domain-containing protein, partial [Chitinophagaceae bacterium]